MVENPNSDVKYSSFVEFARISSFPLTGTTTDTPIKNDHAAVNHARGLANASALQ